MRRLIVPVAILGCLVALVFACYGRRAAPRAAVRLSRRRPLLLPALSAGPGRVGRRALAALGARGERRDAAPGQPDGRRPLSRQAHLRGSSPIPGRRGSTSSSHTLLAFAAMFCLHAVVGDELHAARRSGGARLCVRRADPVPVLQHHLPGRRRLAAARASARSTAGSGWGGGWA